MPVCTYIVDFVVWKFLGPHEPLPLPVQHGVQWADHQAGPDVGCLAAHQRVDEGDQLKQGVTSVEITTVGAGGALCVRVGVAGGSRRVGVLRGR